MSLLELFREARQNARYGRMPKSFGICGLLYLSGGASRDVTDFLNLSVCWPKYSGEYQYPIPGQTGRIPIRPWLGEQRRLRLELLDWCIKQLETAHGLRARGVN